MISIELRQLLDHMAWADALVWGAVLEHTGAERDERLLQLLHHVHEVQLAYTQLIRGETVDVPELASFDSLKALTFWGRSCHAALHELADGLGAERLDALLEIPWADQLVSRYGSARPTTVRQGLLQLASHSAYHRGQINARIRALGGEPPLADFVVWIWSGQPEAHWP